MKTSDHKADTITRADRFSSWFIAGCGCLLVGVLVALYFSVVTAMGSAEILMTALTFLGATALAITIGVLITNAAAERKEQVQLAVAQEPEKTRQSAIATSSSQEPDKKISRER